MISLPKSYLFWGPRCRDNHSDRGNDLLEIQTSWWLNQPIWKICSSSWVKIFPNFRGENEKHLSCHHLQVARKDSPYPATLNPSENYLSCHHPDMCPKFHVQKFYHRGIFVGKIPVKSQVTQSIDAQRFPWTQHGTMHFHGFTHGEIARGRNRWGGQVSLPLGKPMFSLKGPNL